MKETKIIRSGMPFVTAGAAVLLFALIFGMGSVPGYILGIAVGVAGYFAGKRIFPDVTVEVDAAPKSGNAEVDALIVEARAQLAEIEAANRAISDAGLTARIDDSVFLGLNTHYFVTLSDGTKAEIVQESMIDSILPKGETVRLTVKKDKINVLTGDGAANILKGVKNDCTGG